MTVEKKPLWIARLAGSQEEMGHQHGALLAGHGGADAMLAHYRDLPAKMLLGDVPPAARPAGGGRRRLRSHRCPRAPPRPRPPVKPPEVP